MGRAWCGAVIALSLLAGCGDDDKGESDAKSATLEGSTYCERRASLERAEGCSASTTCSIVAECDAAGIAYMDCAARDLSQCYCEQSGDLNCEGSYKANEGPALCVSESQAFGACLEP